MVFSNLLRILLRRDTRSFLRRRLLNVCVPNLDLGFGLLCLYYRKHNEDSLDEGSTSAGSAEAPARELVQQGTVISSKESALEARERQLAERERECKRREGVLSAQIEALSASITVKREKLEASNVHNAQVQNELQQRHRQLQLLSGCACVERACASEKECGCRCLGVFAVCALGLKFTQVHAFACGRQAAEHGKEMLALHSKLREVAEKVQKVEDDMECSFCMENPASTALMPCGHCFCCKEGCGSKTVSVCPCCQRECAFSKLD